MGVQEVRFEFRDDELRRIHADAGHSQKRYGPDLVRAFRKKVALLGAVSDEPELRQHRALHLEKLKGDREGQSSIRLNDQWRLILELSTDEDGRLIVIVEIVDYH